MKKILFTILSIFIINTCLSQGFLPNYQDKKNKFFKSEEGSSYKIEGEIVGLQDTSIILAYYFGGKQYASDTAYSDGGKFIFSGEKKLGGGMYMIVLPNQQYFDLVVSEQKFSFSTNINSLIKSMKFNNSKENTPFYEYLNFITEKQQEVSELKKKLQNTTDKTSKEILQDAIKFVDEDVKSYSTLFKKENSNIFFTKVLQASTEPIIPDGPDTLNKQEKQIYQECQLIIINLTT